MGCILRQFSAQCGGDLEELRQPPCERAGLTFTFPDFGEGGPRPIEGVVEGVRLGAELELAPSTTPSEPVLGSARGRARGGRGPPSPKSGKARGAVASLAQLETPRFGVTPNLRLQGLSLDQRYSIRLLNPPTRPAATMKVAPAFVTGEVIEATGQMIATLGLPMPVLRAGEIAIVQLIACDP